VRERDCRAAASSRCTIHLGRIVQPQLDHQHLAQFVGEDEGHL